MKELDAFLQIAGDRPVWGLTVTEGPRFLVDTKDPEDNTRDTIIGSDIDAIIERLKRVRAKALYVSKHKDGRVVFTPKDIHPNALFFHSIFERFVENKHGVQAAIISDDQHFVISVIPAKDDYKIGMGTLPLAKADPEEWTNKALGNMIKCLMETFGGDDWVTVLDPNELMESGNGLILANLYEKTNGYIGIITKGENNKKETRQ